MKIQKYYLVLIILTSFFLVWYYITYVNDSLLNHFNLRNDRELINLTKRRKFNFKVPEIVIAVVACGDRLKEALTMIKSTIIFNRNQAPLKFVVIAEDKLKQSFREKLEDWQELTDYVFDFEILPLTFPEANKKEWKKLFKPCAAQRLFLPSLLEDIDSVLYVDSDTIFLSPVLEIWERFAKFNSSQFAGMAPEHEDKNAGWYNRFARHPYYGDLGVNSGVMLMNLTRMRNFQWEDHILPIYKDYRLKLVWGDQDIINILFYFHPDKLHLFPCDWNYRADHCMYMSVCEAPDGVKIIHGNRGYFHSLAQPIFKCIYTTIEEYQFKTDVHMNIIRTIEESLAVPSNSNCDKLLDKFLFNPKKYFKEIQYDNT